MSESADSLNMRVSYDDAADVLYLTIGKPDRKAKISEDETGLVWRLAQDGHPQGVTIMAFHQLWDGKQTELATILAKRMSVPLRRVSSELAAAH